MAHRMTSQSDRNEMAGLWATDRLAHAEFAMRCRLEGEGKAERTEGELEKTAADAKSKAETKAEGTKVAFLPLPFIVWWSCAGLMWRVHLTRACVSVIRDQTKLTGGQLQHLSWCEKLVLCMGFCGHMPPHGPLLEDYTHIIRGLACMHDVHQANKRCSAQCMHVTPPLP